MVQSKITVKPILQFPDVVIRDAACNVNSTWEAFLKRFGVDLKKIAPDENFIIRSRKGTSSLTDKIEVISSKYVQRYRILVAVERQGDRSGRNRRRLPTIKLELPQLQLEMGVEQMEFQMQTEETVAAPKSSQRLRAALKRPRMSIPKPNTVAEQLQILREIVRTGQVEMLKAYESEQPERYFPSPSPFPSFSAIMGPSHLNFETRVEKIQDYNVIQRSSVVWQQKDGPVETMRCFSMSDDDFNL